MTDVYILSACRTPIGKFQGALGGFRAPELGAVAVTEALRRAGVQPEQVDEVILGNVIQAGVGQNPARQAARKAGIPDTVPPFTVNKVCGSGLKAVMLAAQAIKAGDAGLIVAGGMESMSQAPYLVPSARTGARLGNAQLVDAMIWDGLWDIYSDQHMGLTGELVAKEYQVSRDDQDRFAVESHRRAAAAQSGGKFAAEIVPVKVPQRKGDPVVVNHDEGIRGDTTQESLGRLKPAFQKDGSVTAGNASQISDGGAAAVVASEKRVQELGAKPLARVLAYASGGMAPEWVMMAPKAAVENLEKRSGLKRHDFDLIEINEAFASGSCALVKTLGLDPAKVNVNGGAVALGHPIGASGARILATLIYALKDRGKKKGLATLCLGGGNAVAMAVELC
ncbi:MAG: acetyl-CoA C-acetyltransferase [Planctomycetota bacterium]|nr:MAG: acetyl-CoA C-acetyltransferase [Planctomycetota bacterium]